MSLTFACSYLLILIRKRIYVRQREFLTKNRYDTEAYHSSGQPFFLCCPESRLSRPELFRIVPQDTRIAALVALQIFHKKMKNSVLCWPSSVDFFPLTKKTTLS